MNDARGTHPDSAGGRLEGRAVARVARAGIAGFVVVLVFEHLLAPELDVLRDRISEYAVRGVGWLMVLGFLAWAVALAASALLARLAVDGPRGLALAGLLAIAAGGMLVTALFATQAVHSEVPAGVARTTAGRLHDAGSGAVFVALLLAALLSLVTVPRVRAVAVIAIAVAFLAPLALPLVGLEAPALAQRLAVLAACLWHWRLAGELGRERRSPLAVVHY